MKNVFPSFRRTFPRALVGSVAIFSACWNATVNGTPIFSERTGAAANSVWNASGNWSSSIPHGAGSSANFGAIATNSTTISLNGGQTVGVMTFGNANGYTLTGGP